ncbi:MAG: hypothetical protein IOD12_01090 [Silvanigrellales bacterium]|nr:hypothetical protein [Silvanigrellales bacterium]
MVSLEPPKNESGSSHFPSGHFPSGVLEPTVLRASRRALALERAGLRAKRLAEAIAKRDNSISLSRLLGSVAYLAVLASFFSRWDAAWKVLGVLSFVAFFLILSRLHARLQSHVSLWKALALTYEASSARWRRDYEALGKLHSPWHKDVASQVPKGHPYAVDLDIPRQIFGLLDAGSCQEVSERLSRDLLLCALPEGEALGELSRRRARSARLLSRSTSLHRRLEAIRLREETLRTYHAYKEEGHEKVFERASEAFHRGLAPSLRLGFAAASVVAWAFFLVPAWREFLATAQFEALVSGLLRYAVFPFAGLLVFTPVMEGSRLLVRKSRTLLSLYEAMARGDVSGVHATTQAPTVVRRLRSLQRALSTLELRGNPVLWLFLHVLFPFDALAGAFLDFRARKVLPFLPTWWEEAVEFDVSVQLARFAHENPDFVFFDENEGEPSTLDIRGLGHPALPADKRVVNDLSLTPDAPVVLLTGSNMAGKSTFLRTLGVNVVLARLGAPVCARFFRCPVRTVACAIRVDDSLEEATSYFYAEVKRLGSILAQLETDSRTKPYTSLFLVDEIFRGTNNRERFLGSWHVIKAFLSSRSFGLVSTHDLALCELGHRDARLVNMHFREHVEDGLLAFDYRLRPGPCPTTNALRIMRLSGLPIPENPEVGDVAAGPLS